MSIEGGEGQHDSIPQQSASAPEQQSPVGLSQGLESSSGQKNTQKSSFFGKLKAPLAAIGLMGGSAVAGQAHVENARPQTSESVSITQPVETSNVQGSSYEAPLAAHKSALEQVGTPPKDPESLGKEPEASGVESVVVPNVASDGVEAPNPTSEHTVVVPNTAKDSPPESSFSNPVPGVAKENISAPEPDKAPDYDYKNAVPNVASDGVETPAPDPEYTVIAPNVTSSNETSTPSEVPVGGVAKDGSEENPQVPTEQISVPNVSKDGGETPPSEPTMYTNFVPGVARNAPEMPASNDQVEVPGVAKDGVGTEAAAPEHTVTAPNITSNNETPTHSEVSVGGVVKDNGGEVKVSDNQVVSPGVTRNIEPSE